MAPSLQPHPPEIELPSQDTGGRGMRTGHGSNAMWDRHFQDSEIFQILLSLSGNVERLAFPTLLEAEYDSAVFFGQ